MADVRRKPGTRPKGDRAAITVRVPPNHRDLYAECAEREGYTCLGDYLTALLAREHGLQVPPYIRMREEGAQLPLAM